MHRLLIPLILLTVMLAPSALAADGCFADYKAKKDKPLRLHYGVVRLPPRACDDPGAAERILTRRLGRDGWTLLTVVSTFDEAGLEKREEDAGEYFLRY
ncbi:hypothetical protein GE300_08410 [Rhodobacteraceae bacterium 2CG4]|uniref:DUF4177 domain-containing protein n=1 Tax=Halovulum marinum TaxID=2662447 RepID=A0A6L5YZI4_9RHOB|nr:hypothetical protein [Halovulum marinum]MSU89638.1 hypothetical protein [Halovulum marinum]